MALRILQMFNRISIAFKMKTCRLQTWHHCFEFVFVDAIVSFENDELQLRILYISIKKKSQEFRA